MNNSIYQLRSVEAIQIFLAFSQVSEKELIKILREPIRLNLGGQLEKLKWAANPNQ